MFYYVFPFHFFLSLLPLQYFSLLFLFLPIFPFFFFSFVLFCPPEDLIRMSKTFYSLTFFPSWRGATGVITWQWCQVVQIPFIIPSLLCHRCDSPLTYRKVIQSQSMFWEVLPTAKIYLKNLLSFTSSVNIINSSNLIFERTQVELFVNILSSLSLVCRLWSLFFLNCFPSHPLILFSSLIFLSLCLMNRLKAYSFSCMLTQKMLCLILLVGRLVICIFWRVTTSLLY